MIPISPLEQADFYKIGHVDQYPKDISWVCSNWTARYTHLPWAKHYVHFGLKYFIMEYLEKQWNEGFFLRPLDRVLTQYRELIRATLGVKEPRTDHIEYLHSLGHLPLQIFSLPEGTSVPIGVPSMVFCNTDPKCFWLTNFIETCMSNALWKPITSATIAQHYRKDVFEPIAREFGHTDLSFVDWQGHDFSYRGMSGLEDACLSGMGHLLSFNGTDTIPAIRAADYYYSSGLGVGGSVAATEHSVMCAGGKEDEFATFKRLITEVHAAGIVSIVSDTWDLWRVLEEYLPRLSKEILGREGKVVLRPDSGDPVEVSLRALSIIKDKFGVDRLGMLAGGKIGLIYGDSITPDRARTITQGMVRDLKISPFNMVFGIGSYTYEYQTRDSLGQAIKATSVRRDGKTVPIFKDPVTDNGGKKSAFGIPTVHQTPEGLVLKQDSSYEDLFHCAFKLVYQDGVRRTADNFATIRARVRG